MENLDGFGIIIEQSINEIYIIDAKTLKFKMVNRSGRSNIGYSALEISQLTFNKLIPGFTLKKIKEFLQPLTSGELNHLVFESKFIRKDKSTYDVNVNLQLLEIDGEAQYVAFVNDITEKKAAKIKLERSEAHYRTLVDHIPDVITRYDANLMITYISDSIVHHTGKTPEYYIGKLQENLGYTKDMIALFYERTYEAVVEKRVVYYEIKIPIDNNTFRYYFNSVVPEFAIDGTSVVSLLSISRDITEQKNLEAKLKKNIDDLKLVKKELFDRNKQLEDFANIASHNLRSPAGNLQMLLNLYETEEDSEKKEFFIKKFKDVSDRLHQTIDNLTEVVKIRMDTDKKREVLYFENILKEMVDTIYGQIIESNAEITWNFDDCKTIFYPKVYLESILLNLLTNSIKYRATGRVPKIHFETKFRNNKILLSCKDNGLGIDLKKHGQKIFGMNKTFHRNSDARGIGLFITKNQIEALGGSITVQSQVDKGTTFLILFGEKDNFYEEDRHRLHS